MLNQLMELVNTLKSGETSPQEIAKKVRQALPPHFLAAIKSETTTPESIIGQLEPLVASFMGPDTVALLKSEATITLLGQALVILRAED